MDNRGQIGVRPTLEFYFVFNAVAFIGTEPNPRNELSRVCYAVLVDNASWRAPQQPIALSHCSLSLSLSLSTASSGLGTHISFVRSVRMDHWTDRQIQLMKTGGNDACRIFLQERGVDLTITRPASRAMIQARYDCPAAVLYKQVLQARADGRPEPTDLTNNLNNMRGSENTTGPPSSPLPPPLPPVKRKMEGFGNTTPPPSSNGSGLVPLKPWLWAVPTVAAAAVAYVILSHYGGA